jgi:hypothetical protein
MFKFLFLLILLSFSQSAFCQNSTNNEEDYAGIAFFMNTISTFFLNMPPYSGYEYTDSNFILEIDDSDEATKPNFFLNVPPYSGCNFIINMTREEIKQRQRIIKLINFFGDGDLKNKLPFPAALNLKVLKVLEKIETRDLESTDLLTLDSLLSHLKSLLEFVEQNKKFFRWDLNEHERLQEEMSQAKSTERRKETTENMDNFVLTQSPNESSRKALYLQISKFIDQLQEVIKEKEESVIPIFSRAKHTEHLKKLHRTWIGEKSEALSYQTTKK